ncbi:hypothetical protein D3C72_1778850 [compost metagenome]
MGLPGGQVQFDERVSPASQQHEARRLALASRHEQLKILSCVSEQGSEVGLVADPSPVRPARVVLVVEGVDGSSVGRHDRMNPIQREPRAFRPLAVPSPQPGHAIPLGRRIQDRDHLRETLRRSSA